MLDKRGSIIITLILMISVFIAVGCFGERAVEPTLDQVVFESPLLESIIREKINKQTGKITKEDMLLITELDSKLRCTSKTLWTIRDLKGLEHATNLTVLRFANNEITDLTPLAELTNLTELSLMSNKISDLTPLAELTNLTELDLGGNRITDLTPLAELTNLIELNFVINEITELTPLASLMNLTSLRLSNNNIADITPLLGLTNLAAVTLSENPLSETAKQDIEVLQERGVGVLQ